MQYIPVVLMGWNRDPYCCHLNRVWDTMNHWHIVYIPARSLTQEKKFQVWILHMLHKAKEDSMLLNLHEISEVSFVPLVDREEVQYSNCVQLLYVAQHHIVV